MNHRKLIRTQRRTALVLVAVFGLSFPSAALPKSSEIESNARIDFVVSPDGSLVPTVRRAPSREARGQGAQAGTEITNGSFTDGLEGWTVSESGGESEPGVVAVEASRAVLLEGDSFLVTLSQTFTVPNAPIILTLDLFLDPGFSLEDNFIPDAFEVTLLGAGDVPLLDAWDPLATSSFNIQEDGTAYLGSQASWDGQTVTLDLAGLPTGTEATLYLDLVGGDGDTESALSIDDVTTVVTAEPGTFRRGDIDGSGLVDAVDAQSLFDALWGDPLDPPGCAGDITPDAADVNDNEVLTIADYLAARSLEGQSPPCDFDPDDDLRGFDVVDEESIVSVGNITFDPPVGSVDRVLSLPVLVSSPRPLTGLTLILEFDSDVLQPLDPNAGDPTEAFTSGLGETRVVAAGDKIVFALWTPDDSTPLVSGSAETLEQVGTVFFRLEDFATVRPFQWLSEATVDDVPFRATMVDDSFADHQPTSRSGEYEFVRGNSNNDDAVDISDPVYTLTFLFLGGPAPVCMDAADADNDSVINITDPVFELNFLFLGGPPIPPPYPVCGLDEGPVDLLGCGPCACGPYPAGDPCATEK